MIKQFQWQHSNLWYASTIAHDGRNKEPNPLTWTGRKAEKACLKFQLQTARDLNADQYTLEYLQKHLKNPTY